MHFMYVPDSRIYCTLSLTGIDVAINGYEIDIIIVY